MLNKITPQKSCNFIESSINWASSTRLVDNVSKKFEREDHKFIAGLAVGSIVVKDGFGCYLYVHKSLKNEEIPEKKRKFVAALDFTNGSLMILSQIAMFFTISNKKVQDRIFNTLFSKPFEKFVKTAYKKIKSNPKFANLNKDLFDKESALLKEQIKGAFNVLTSLIASAIIAKRVIVPFVATPLADVYKTKLEKKHKQS